MSDDPNTQRLDTEATAVDPYIDPETGILRNRLGIRTWRELKEAEAYLVRINFERAKERFALFMRYYLVDYLSERFSVNCKLPTHLSETQSLYRNCCIHWRFVHEIIFKHIYDWAGEFRTVPIGRPDEKPCFNASPETLENECGAALGAAVMDRDFLENIASHYAELNFQHPFREGNGRTLKVLISAMVEAHGAAMDWTRVERAPYEAALRQWNRTAETAPLDAVLRTGLAKR